MNRTTTRGLAVSAVSALAVTGLSLVAAPPAQAAAPEVEMISQSTGIASQRYDTSGTSTRLVARIDPTNTESVKFELNPDPEAGDGDPGWRDLNYDLDPSPTIVGSYAAVEWFGGDINGNSYVGERVALRAAATNLDGTTFSTVNDVEVVDDKATDSVSIQTSAARYFLQPYADTDHASAFIAVNGVTTATEGTVELSTWRDDTGEFVGRTAASVTPFSAKLPSEELYTEFGRVAGQVELTAYDIQEGFVAVAAERDADDVAPIALTRQQITYVGASSDSNIREGEQGRVSIRVDDADRQPILGAEVRRLSDDTLVGYTNRDGFAFATQDGDTTEEYYANATDADPFDANDGDVASGTVTTTTYQPEPTYTTAVLGDGTLFDVDEYDAGDIAVVVTDNRGRPVGAGESVSYAIAPGDVQDPETDRTALTNADGVAVLDFDTAGANGDYLLSYVLTSRKDDTSEQTIRFSTGQAELLLSPKASPVAEAAGGQIDYFGRLVLGGEPLPDRRIDLSYARGVEVVPGNTADAGIVTPDGRRLQASRTTNHNGSFRVTIDDAEESPQASEVDGVLTAATGDTVPAEELSIDGNADAVDTSVTRFGDGQPGTAPLRLSGSDNGADADRLTVTGPTSLAGESIKVFRVNARGKRFLVTTKTLNSTGDRPTIVVADGNGRARTTYVVRLLASDRVQASDSNTKALR